MKRFVFALLLVAGLAACSSGAGSGSQTFATAAELASKIGCTGYSKDAQDPVARDSGSCTLDGQSVQVYVFNDDNGRDALIKSFPGSWAKGSKWALTSTDQATVKAASTKAGGATE